MTPYELGVRLLKACEEGNLTEMAALLKQGADPNFKIPKTDTNPLHPDNTGSEHPVWYVEGPFHHNPDCDSMVNLLVKYGAVIPKHYSWHSRGRAMTYHMVRQGFPVDYRLYHWAKRSGFDEIIDALEERGVYSDCPVYDVDALLATSPPWVAIHKIFELCDGYTKAPHPQTNHHERVLCDAWECAGEAANGLDYALSQANFSEIFSRREALEEIGAMAAWRIVHELRSYFRSLGAKADLEFDDLPYLLFTGTDGEKEEKEEKLTKFAQDRTPAFLKDINQSLASWLRQNLAHFRVRRPRDTAKTI